MSRRVLRELTIISIETTLLLALAATAGVSRAEFDRKSNVARGVNKAGNANHWSTPPAPRQRAKPPDISHWIAEDP